MHGNRINVPSLLAIVSIVELPALTRTLVNWFDLRHQPAATCQSRQAALARQTNHPPKIWFVLALRSATISSSGVYTIRCTKSGFATVLNAPNTTSGIHVFPSRHPRDWSLGSVRGTSHNPQHTEKTHSTNIADALSIHIQHPSIHPQRSQPACLPACQPKPSVQAWTRLTPF